MLNKTVPLLISIMMHTKCRNGVYPGSRVQRISVVDKQVSWDCDFADYKPPFYEAPSLKDKPWADAPSDDEKFSPIWNSLDGNVNRVSHQGAYKIFEKLPQNPVGRTGIAGRGLLGRWGPNHAVDPIVTRWKLAGGQKVINESSKLPVLQFVAIQRRDCKEWAIPGGMVDPGEDVSVAMLREFTEEAMNSLESKPTDTLLQELRDFFAGGVVLYRGYVDDHRNTDNAWIETVARNCHDDDGSSVGKFELNAGDDAQKVRWMDIDGGLALYASHLEFIREAVRLRNAHW